MKGQYSPIVVEEVKTALKVRRVYTERRDSLTVNFISIKQPLDRTTKGFLIPV